MQTHNDSTTSTEQLSGSVQHNEGGDEFCQT